MRLPAMQRQASGRLGLARDAVQHDPAVRADTVRLGASPRGSKGTATRTSVTGRSDCAHGETGDTATAAGTRIAASQSARRRVAERAVVAGSRVTPTRAALPPAEAAPGRPTSGYAPPGDGGSARAWPRRPARA